MSIFQSLLGSVSITSTPIFVLHHVLWEWDSNNLPQVGLIAIPNTVYAENTYLTNSPLLSLKNTGTQVNETWNNNTSGYSMELAGTGYFFTDDINSLHVWNSPTSGITFEMWFYPTSVSTCLVNLRDNETTPTYDYSMMEIDADGLIVAALWNAQICTYLRTNEAVVLNQWNHISFHYSKNGNISVCLNSQTTNTVSLSSWANPTNMIFGIGKATDSDNILNNKNNFLGKIGLVRIFNYDNGINGYGFDVARFIAPVTIPTSNLLVQFDSVNITSFGSLQFDANSQQILNIPNNLFAQSGDFTIELWFYRTVQTPYDGIVNIGIDFVIQFDQIGQLLYIVNGFNMQPVGAISLNTWCHVAMVRSGSTVMTYFQGVLIGQTDYSATTSNTLTFGHATTGYQNYFTGNMAEIRYSNVARYNSAFTPPTTPFTTDANTLMLMLVEGEAIRFEDSSGNNVNIGNFQTASGQSLNPPDNSAGIDSPETKLDIYGPGYNIPLFYVPVGATVINNTQNWTDTVLNAESPTGDTRFDRFFTLQNHNSFVGGETYTFNWTGAEPSYSGLDPYGISYWNDLSGNNHNAELIDSPTITPGQYGSYSFSTNNGQTFTAAGYISVNGSGQYANAGDILPSGNYTKVAFFRSPNYGSSPNLISGQSIAFWVPNGLLSAGITADSYSDVSYSTILQPNEWYMGGVTFSTTNGYTLYVNGINVATSTSSLVPGGNNEPIYVGSHMQTSFFTGDFYSALVYTEALDDNDMMQIFNHYRGRVGI